MVERRGLLRKRRGAAAHRRGLWAERFCAFYLCLKGYRLVACRYKTNHGEIDWIVRQGETLVFVEVKARPSLLQASEAITDRQKTRLKKAAAHFIASHPHYNAFTQRFDAVLITPWCMPQHFINAF